MCCFNKVGRNTQNQPQIVNGDSGISATPSRAYQCALFGRVRSGLSSSLEWLAGIIMVLCIRMSGYHFQTAQRPNNQP
jgi:hypothetical protein